MNIVRVDGLDQPYMEDDTIYMPTGTNSDTQWCVVSKIPIAIIVRVVWASNPGYSDMGWVVDKWMFFDRQEIAWEQVQDKVAVAREARKRLRLDNSVIPWGDDIETLVALESL